MRWAADVKLVSKLMADHGINDRARLEEVIGHARMEYDGAVYWAHEKKPNTLWKLATHLGLVLSHFDQEGNEDGILRALGADETLEKRKRAIDRHEELIRDLWRMRLALPASPQKRPRGKPRKTKNLHALVCQLAEYWVSATGKPFTQAWEKVEGKRVPQSRSSSTAFVYDIVQFIDSKQLRALPKVTEKIVSERRAATCRKNRPTCGDSL